MELEFKGGAHLTDVLILVIMEWQWNNKADAAVEYKDES